MDFSQNLNAIYTRLRENLGPTVRDFEWRKKQLQKLKAMLEENDHEINEALWLDLHKSRFESEASEQGVVLSEINCALENLTEWMTPIVAATPLYNQIGKSHIRCEPFGLTLIIGAWNYPINLLLSPLVSAIAGGNAAIIKPSEISAHTAKVISKLIPKYLDPNSYAVIEGGAIETGILLEKPFDLIFFTGSSNVGKIVLAKAAPNLTPVVLELGGKSPAYVDKHTNMKITARRIAWGKFMNAGQTCVAPDYVLIDPTVKAEFLSEIKNVIQEFYGESPEASPDYCRIINEKNFSRLQGLMDGTQIIHGGIFKKENLFISPTVVTASPDSKIMQEEIFGPILPVLEMESVEKAIAFINQRPKPLALYVYTQNDKVSKSFEEQTSSGALCVNDNVIHMPMTSLPFGGVGASGMGNYHGIYGFKTFTHAKGVLDKSFHPDISVRYPPYSYRKEKVLGWLME
jgi:aldehyde dehydrogenase (NAD+)